MSSTSTPDRNSGFRITLGIAAALLAACADNPPASRLPGEAPRAVRCAHDETLSCVEKLGKVVSCSCSSREELRRILEPERL